MILVLLLLLLLLQLLMFSFEINNKITPSYSSSSE